MVTIFRPCLKIGTMPRDEEFFRQTRRFDDAILCVLQGKELILTLSMERQAEVCAILSTNGIDYQVKTTNLQNQQTLDSRRAHAGSSGIFSDHSYEYKIYVHKRDYEKAKYLIGTPH